MSSATWLSFCMYFFYGDNEMYLALLHTAKALLFLLSRKMLSLERDIHTDPWSIAEAALLRPEGGRLWMTDLLSEWVTLCGVTSSLDSLQICFFTGGSENLGEHRPHSFLKFLHLESSVSFFIYKHIVTIKYIVQTLLVQIWICFCSITGGSPRAHISIYL